MRISRFLSSAGIASRRKSESLILDGKITVNGVIVKDLSARIDTCRDKVKFLDKEILLQEKVYLALNKPPGYLSTVKDNFNRQTVIDLVREFSGKTRLFPVGRLDMDSRGLILLTNDGDFSLKITHPKYMVTKSYEIILDRNLEKGDFVKMINGVFIDNQKVIISELKTFKLKNEKCKVKITIHEGRKRILRKLFDSLGYKVIDLKRIKIGELSLGNLREGRYRTLDGEDINKIFKKMQRYRKI